MDKYILIFILAIVSVFGHAQSLEKKPNWLIGIEANIHFQNVQSGKSDFRYSGIGLHIEKPVGQFSFGTAVIKQNFSGHSFYQSTGYIRPPNGPNSMKYGYNQRIEKIKLINIPLRIQYRLPPCNCAYIQAAFLTNFLLTKALYSEENILLIDEPTDDIFSISDISTFSPGYELAVGFNMHASDFVKIIGRFSYIHYSFIENRPQQFKNLDSTYLSFNLGLQYAFYKKDVTDYIKLE